MDHPLRPHLHHRPTLTTQRCTTRTYRTNGQAALDWTGGYLVGATALIAEAEGRTDVAVAALAKWLNPRVRQSHLPFSINNCATIQAGKDSRPTRGREIACNGLEASQWCAPGQRSASPRSATAGTSGHRFTMPACKRRNAAISRDDSVWRAITAVRAAAAHA